MYYLTNFLYICGYIKLQILANAIQNFLRKMMPASVSSSKIVVLGSQARVKCM